jgi:hypothetical protein
MRATPQMGGFQHPVILSKIGLKLSGGNNILVERLCDGTQFSQNDVMKRRKG